MKVNSTGLAPGTTLYFKFTGDIDNNDFIAINLLDQFKIGNDLSINIGRAIDNDLKTEGTETVLICLLYTSPSPRDLSTSRMPSSA